MILGIRTKIENIGSSLDMALPFANAAYTRIFDSMRHAPIESYVRREDLYALYQLATNPKYSSSDMQSRLEVYDAIMNPLGFTRAFSGTNRVVYSCNTDDSFLLKIGLDSVGINDNKSEFKNQYFLKPFIPKVYEVSNDGVIEMIERVHPIMSREEFAKYAMSTFRLTYYLINHGFVLEDIGTDYFMNWGVRDNFGPVLLDFPYIYRLNTDRLLCTKYIKGVRCTGHLDYDEGYNHIKCSKCGAVYKAKDIGSSIEYLKKRKKGSFKMDAPIKITLTKGNKSITHVITDDGVDHIEVTTAENIVKNNDNQKRKNIRPEAENRRLNNDHYIGKFNLDNIFAKTLNKIKFERKIDNLSNEAIESIMKYIDMNHSDFIIVPSVILNKNIKLTNEGMDELKTALSEDAGVRVTGVTEISIGDYNMYISSKPIILIPKFIQCAETAINTYLDNEEKNNSQDEDTVEQDDTELAEAINDITKDNSVTFDSTNANTIASPIEDKQMILANNKDSLGPEIIDATDAVVIPARQTRSFDDEF